MSKHFFPGKGIIYGFIAVLFLIQYSAGAQNKDPDPQDYLFLQYAEKISKPYSPKRPYYICSATARIQPGIERVRQLDDNTIIIRVNSTAELAILQGQTRIGPATDRWKYSPFAERMIDKEYNRQQHFILSGPDRLALSAALNNIKGPLAIVSSNEPSRSVIVRTTARFLKETLLTLPEISFVDLQATPQTEIGIIGYNRSFHGLSAVDFGIPGANGKNIVAGVKEQRMGEADLDLFKRVLPSSLAAGNVTNHATVVSSIIGGAGNSFYDGRGIAWGCKFFSSSFSNLFADDAVILNTNKVTVQNHSYGTVIQQFYGAEALSYDAQVWANRNFVPVFSSGNQGTGAATEGQYANIPGYANLTGNFKMAKNIITAGAIDNKGNIPAESSSGPLYDGRIAPQLIALGPNGTSDAAAVVSGTIAVLQQVYADSNSQVLPPASLVKAVLYNAADDIHKTGIDYKTGYGLLNSFASVKAIQQKEYDGATVAQGQQWIRAVNVPANTSSLKVTLAWTDSPSSLNNNRALINDLDLEVLESGTGNVYRPWVLSTAAHRDSLAKPPVRKRDSLNTAEQVTIALPAPGNYQLRVTGTLVSTPSISFHVAWHTDTLLTFRFVSPQHTSDVNRDENPVLDIRWQTFVADTNQTGDLFISYDGGAGWQLLKQAQKIYTNYYSWPVKDTASRALLKMETAFGDFFSPEFIIHPVSRPVVDFLCSDSAGLSWNKHLYTGSYKVYSQADSAYLKLVLTVNDTTVVLQRSQYPSLVYAVEPVPANGLPAARSIAVDISLQGVKCFYRTFYYTLQDQNRLELVLELSAARYADSIYFDQVTIAGQGIHTAGGVKVNSGISIYGQFVTDVPSGTSYWRARIKLKSGAVVYTEIISVLTSGKRNILFYPNPVRRGNQFALVIRQGIPAGNRLQLYDISGRLLRDYSEIPGSIDISALATGIIIYKLFGNDNSVLGTGKLVIQ